MDRVAIDVRRRNMSRIRAKDTQPELVVRKLVRGLGRRYRLHASDLPGRPDLVFRKARKVIFVHGCFWHRHQRCKNATLPASRTDFWLAKLSRNVERDREVQATLCARGWHTLVIWECELSNADKVRIRLTEFLEI